MGNTPQELRETMDSSFEKIEGKTEMNGRTTPVAKSVALWFCLAGEGGETSLHQETSDVSFHGAGTLPLEMCPFGSRHC